MTTAVGGTEEVVRAAIAAMNDHEAEVARLRDEIANLIGDREERVFHEIGEANRLRRIATEAVEAELAETVRPYHLHREAIHDAATAAIDTTNNRHVLLNIAGDMASYLIGLRKSPPSPGYQYDQEAAKRIRAAARAKWRELGEPKIPEALLDRHGWVKARIAEIVA